MAKAELFDPEPKKYVRLEMTYAEAHALNSLLHAVFGSNFVDAFRGPLMLISDALDDAGVGHCYIFPVAVNTSEYDPDKED